MSDVSEVLAGKVLDRLVVMSVDTGFDLVDGGILRTPSQPFVSFFAGTAVAEEQRFCDARPRLCLPVTVMVVNSSPSACRVLTGTVTDALDDAGRQPTDGLRIIPTSSSGQITEDQVEGDWRYSITTYFDAREA